MKIAVRNAFVDFTAPMEGVVGWLYADVKGLVTIAIGNLVDPIDLALDLPLVRKDGSPATKQEIRDEWSRVKTDPRCATLGHRYAERITSLRLTAAGISHVVLSKLADVERQLVRRFPDFGRWPADAQLATFSMAWACGAGFVFPKLHKALIAMDFETASRECKMSEVGNPGLKPRNVANALLYVNAARVRAQGLDPEILQWPGEVDEMTPLPATLPEITIARPAMLASDGIAEAAIADYQDGSES